MSKQAIICISLIFCLGVVVVSAYPTEKPFAFDKFITEAPKPRFSLDGTSIGGSPKQGFDINANSRFPIWSSQNGRNSFDGTAGYSQHVGGPYGNSRPDYRGGLIFTHRF